jgi:hypothetical protein
MPHIGDCPNILGATRRTALQAAAGVVFGSAIPAYAGSSSPLYLEAVAAYHRWFSYAHNVWGQIVPGSPEWKASDDKVDALSEDYHAAFRRFLDFALAEPNNQRLGEVAALWRLNCWNGDEEIGQMDDPMEARTLWQMLEKMTGVKVDEPEGDDHV